jgi:HEAT repeat protein
MLRLSCKLACVCVSVGLIGCGGYPGPVSIDNEDPAIKIPAIRRAIDANDRSQIPRIVKELESEDSAVRVVAIEALERFTGQSHGYQWWQGPKENKTAIQRWNNSINNRPIDFGIEPTTAPATRPAK